MALSVEQLTTPVTETEALEQHLDILESLDFPARSWQSGSVPRTFVQLTARLRANASTLINSIASAGFNSLASGGWLTLLSASHFSNARQAAVRARIGETLTVASGSGPYTKAAGTVVVKDPTTGQQYRNVNSETLTSSAPVVALFEAEVAGAAGSEISTGSVNTLVTSIAGVTCTNAAGWDSVSGAVTGADEETDAELKTRNSSKWASLGIGGPKAAYAGWALEALASVTRVGVDDTNAAGTGVIAIYLADADGGTSDTGNAVRDYLLGDNGDGTYTGRHPLGPPPTITAATNVPVTVSYTATYSPAVFTGATAAADAVAAIDAAITAFFAANPVSDSSSGSLSLGGLYAAAFAVPGIINVIFTSPTASQALTAGRVATISGSISGSATAAT